MTTLNDATVRHLLVVDDDDRIRTLLKEFLARHGFRVTAAAHADAAKRMLQLLDFDLLILPTTVDLSLWRIVASVVAVGVLLYGFIWESE